MHTQFLTNSLEDIYMKYFIQPLTLVLRKQDNLTENQQDGDTPLHQLCKKNHYAIILIVKELLKMSSIYINIENNQHLIPITVAREHNHHEIEAILTTIERSNKYENISS